MKVATEDIANEINSSPLWTHKGRVLYIDYNEPFASDIMHAISGEDPTISSTTGTSKNMKTKNIPEWSKGTKREFTTQTLLYDLIYV